MAGNFGDASQSSNRVLDKGPKRYTITFNKRKKRWQLKKRNSIVFSATEKKDVDFWYKEVISKNCLIF